MTVSVTDAFCDGEFPYYTTGILLAYITTPCHHDTAVSRYSDTPLIYTLLSVNNLIHRTVTCMVVVNKVIHRKDPFTLFTCFLLVKLSTGRFSPYPLRTFFGDSFLLII